MSVWDMVRLCLVHRQLMRTSWPAQPDRVNRAQKTVTAREAAGKRCSFGGLKMGFAAKRDACKTHRPTLLRAARVWRGNKAS
jgi:hypothetical protein